MNCPAWGDGVSVYSSSAASPLVDLKNITVCLV